MKILMSLSLIITSLSLNATQIKIPVQARAAVEFWYNEFNTNDVKLTNTTDQEIDVSILDTNTLNVVETFKLKAKAELTFFVKNACLLKLYNPSNQAIELLMEFVARDGEEEVKTNTGEKIKLVLSNTVKTEFVLKLPSGSVSKLGPGSNTGMYFKLGDEVYFIHEEKEYLLFKVDETFKTGDIININKYARIQLDKIEE